MHSSEFEPSSDVVYRALVDPDRRRILGALAEYDPGKTISALDVVRRGERDAERLKTALYHNHLPRLDDAGFVSWDRSSLAVERGQAFDDVQSVLEQDAVPWIGPTVGAD